MANHPDVFQDSEATRKPVGFPPASTPAPQAPARAPAQAPAPASSGLTDRLQGFLDKGGNRAALLQFGLQLMQPVPFGQNALGAAASALGSGFEAKGRFEQTEQKESIIEDKRRVEDEKLDIQRKNAESRRIGATKSSAGQGLSLSQILTGQRADKKAFQKFRTDFLKSRELTGEVPTDAEILQAFKASKSLEAEALGATPQNLTPPPGFPPDAKSPDGGKTWFIQRDGKFIQVSKGS